jgi:hypothetical protein
MMLDQIIAAAGQGSVEALSAQAQSASALTSVELVYLTSDGTGLAADITTLNASISANDTTMAANAVTIATAVDRIETAETTLDTEIANDEIALLAHLDTLFSADCKVNLVQVPILVTGGDGFYTGPSTGLVRAVQSYLDEIKEVTHLVEVVSGSTNLVPAYIEIEVKYDNTVVQSEVKASIEAGIDDILRGRDFDTSLYMSDLAAVLDAIDGYEYVNTSITAPASHIDGDGNLIVAELEIVTKGGVTVTAIED